MIDLYVGLGHFTANLLYRNNLEGGSLSFTEVGGALGVQQPIDGGISLWGDLDNDGDLDLLAGDPSNQPWVLYRNTLVENGTPGFTDITGTAGLSPGDYQSALLFFDMDNDGDLDVFSRFKPLPSQERLSAVRQSKGLTRSRQQGVSRGPVLSPRRSSGPFSPIEKVLQKC